MVLNDFERILVLLLLNDRSFENFLQLILHHLEARPILNYLLLVINPKQIHLLKIFVKWILNFLFFELVSNHVLVFFLLEVVVLDYLGVVALVYLERFGSEAVFGYDEGLVFVASRDRREYFRLQLLL